MKNIDRILDLIFREKFPRIVSDGEHRDFKMDMTILGEYWHRFPGLRPQIRKRLRSSSKSLMDDFLWQIVRHPSGLKILLARGETIFFDGLISFTIEVLIWIIGVLNCCPYHPSRTFVEWLKQCPIKPAGLYALFLAIIETHSFKVRFEKFVKMIIAVCRWRKALKTTSGARLKMRRKFAFDLAQPPQTHVNTRWRNIVRRFISNFRKTKHVKGVFLGGSIGRRFHDIYSDFDIWVFCDRLPSLKERESVLSKIRDPKTPFGRFGYFDWMVVCGVCGHIMFVRESDQKRMLDSVRKGDPEYAIWGEAKSSKKWDTVMPPHTYLAGMICYDPEKLLARHIKQLKKYPELYRKGILMKEGRYGWERLALLQKYCSSRDPVPFFIEWNDLVVSLYRLMGNRHSKYIDRVNPKWVRHEMKSYGREGRVFLKIIGRTSTGMTSENLEEKYKAADGLYRWLSGREESKEKRHERAI